MREHKDEIIVFASLLVVAVIAGILVTASGKAIVVELDGLNSTSQDGDGNYEERHVDGGKLKFYAE